VQPRCRQTRTLRRTRPCAATREPRNGPSGLGHRHRRRFHGNRAVSDAGWQVEVDVARRPNQARATGQRRTRATTESTRRSSSSRTGGEMVRRVSQRHPRGTASHRVALQGTPLATEDDRRRRRQRKAYPDGQHVSATTRKCESTRSASHRAYQMLTAGAYASDGATITGGQEK